MYPLRSKSAAIALVIGSCGDPATTTRHMSNVISNQPRIAGRLTNNLLPSPIPSFPSLSPLTIQLFTSVQQDTSSADKCDESRSPRTVANNPVLCPIGQSTRAGRVGCAHRWTDGTRQPCLLGKGIANHSRCMVELTVDGVGHLCRVSPDVMWYGRELYKRVVSTVTLLLS